MLPFKDKPLSEISGDDISYSLRRYYVDSFQQKLFAQISFPSRVLDIGGVRGVTRGEFRMPDDFRRVVLNIRRSHQTDLAADAALLPLVSKQFDVVLCAEVLEHVIAPPAVLHQTWRILKPGGRLIVTVPFLFRQHADPSDYGRYTEWYWRAHLERLGFENIQIEKQGLFFSVFVDMLRHWMANNLLNGGGFYRLRSWSFRKIYLVLRKYALRFDEQPVHQVQAFWGAYPGGFGIQAFKPEQR
ncbi:MAG: methyltransferase domain-containing protein [Anaerolineales bacterium]|nr:methyltransferase domain-containing protein [Anaerolineales bacterium]MCW5855417.1 methyltransferase domain-containing protein [Anaerolineales bacterium]